MLFALGGLAAVALLIVALQPPAHLDFASINPPPNAIPLPTAIAPPAGIVPPEQVAAPALETEKPVAPKPAATAAAVRSATPVNASNDKTTVEPLKAMAIEPVANSLAERTPNSALESPSRVAVETVASVTITGCLANDDDTFVLKDTSGADAPKARSWKSGFLKKRSATIELLDATKALRLPSFVGQRVEATGMLVNHEMRAHALRRVAASCS